MRTVRPPPSCSPCLVLPSPAQRFFWFRYDTVFDVIAGAFRLAVGKELCAVLRYCYPVPWLYDLASATLGWASLNPAPLPEVSDTNCNGDPDEIVFCMALGSGYVLLEFLVPLVVAVVTAGLLWNVLKVAINAAIDAVEVGRHKVLKSLGVVVRTAKTAEADLKGLGPLFADTRLRLRAINT